LTNALSRGRTRRHAASFIADTAEGKKTLHRIFHFLGLPLCDPDRCHVSLCEVIRVRNFAFSDNNRMLMVEGIPPLKVGQGCFGVD